MALNGATEPKKVWDPRRLAVARFHVCYEVSCKSELVEGEEFPTRAR